MLRLDDAPAMPPGTAPRGCPVMVSPGLNPDAPRGRLLRAPMRPGRLDWIGLRPARRAPMRSVAEARLTVADGLVGDRYAGSGGQRQVTLMQAEHLPAVAAFAGLERLEPAALRRNLLVSGLNLLALNGAAVRIGDALLEVTGPCHPCSRMEETLGIGGYNALRGHGGLTARVLQPGVIRLGDAVRREDGPT